MTARLRPALLAAASLTAIAIACGEVPTLENGIAYLLPLELPAPAVAVGDTLRDTLGRAAPLRVRAIGRDGAEVTGLSATFLPTALPARALIDTNGYVVAGDTVGTVQIVGRVGSSLQTAPVALAVVPQAGAAAATSSLRLTVAALPALDTLRVTVTGPYHGATTAVAGVIVRYRITSFARSGADARAVLAADAGAVSRTDSTAAVDTTDANGLASRVLVVSGTGVDSVAVRASATNFRGIALPALDFVLRVRP
jgi:hypothetical protein